MDMVAKGREFHAGAIEGRIWAGLARNPIAGQENNRICKKNSPRIGMTAETEARYFYDYEFRRGLRNP
ncbi:MAG: hypothetical protein AB7P49_18625 [Bdellovibrionales bacterium]